MLVKGQPILVIGVMGVTGSGKSTFVQKASGNEDDIVGHSLEACTQKVTAYEFNANGYNIIIVDTPGFNDTYRSDTEILLDLARWLELTYRQNARLTGIVYMHRIIDVRMDGSAMRNLKMFRKLCGEKPMENVVIASTFWGQIPEERAVEHERELMGKADFWGDMIEHGAQVRRFDGTQASALDILMGFARKGAVTLDIQRELVDEEKPLGDTAAGSAVNEELHRLRAKYSAELDRLRQETATALAEKDVQYERILEQQRRKMEAKLERITIDQEELHRERRDEIRRLEADNARKFSLMRAEYEARAETDRLAAERGREEDRSAFREQMREMRTGNAVLTADFTARMADLQNASEEQARELRMENDELRRAAAAAAAVRGPSESVTTTTTSSSGGSFGGKLANLVAAGGMALIDPLAIPLALASLADFVSEW